MDLLKTLGLVFLMCLLLEGVSVFLFDPAHPRMLIRFSAAQAIEHSDDFLWNTRLVFATGELSLSVPFPSGQSVLEEVGLLSDAGLGPCKILARIDPSEKSCGYYLLTNAGNKTVEEYALMGLLTQVPSAPQSECFSGHFHLVKQDRVNYWVVIGQPVVRVTGILKENHHATVDFDWRFGRLNELGKLIEAGGLASLLGHARFVEYDDGWRITKIDAGGWGWGPPIGDPYSVYQPCWARGK